MVGPINNISSVSSGGLERLMAKHTPTSQKVVQEPSVKTEGIGSNVNGAAELQINGAPGLDHSQSGVNVLFRNDDIVYESPIGKSQEPPNVGKIGSYPAGESIKIGTKIDYKA